MVHLLIRMRAAALANSRTSRFGIASLVIGGLIGLAIALSTLLIGFTTTETVTGGTDRIALVTFTWVVGRVGFAGFSGADSAVPLDLFRIVPVPPRTLARTLLVLGLADPALWFLAIAFGSTIVFGFRQGISAGLAGLAGVVVLLVLVSVLSTIVSAAAPTGSRRRQDFGALLAALLISAVTVAGTLIGPLLSRLGAGRLPELGAVLRAVPTGWVAESVLLAEQGNPAAVIPVFALAGLVALLVAWWPRLLTERLLSAGATRRRERARRRRVLPATPVGAVAARELRAWIRDPNRAGFLLVAVTVGLGICVVPLVSHGTTLLLPFAGLGTIVIAAAVAGNGYGFDGPALALVLSAADAERAEVRGRQLAWLLLIGPYATLLSLAGLLVGHVDAARLWVLALIPALLGGGAGMIAIISLVAVQPLDDNGTPGPTWVVKTYATMLLTVVSALPTLALLIAGAITGNSALYCLALPVGLTSGIGCATGFGRLAEARLRRCGPEIFQQLATAPNGRR